MGREREGGRERGGGGRGEEGRGREGGSNKPVVLHRPRVGLSN